MWKQRIYAFLLKRLIGPYLTPQSKNRLHQSLSINLTEGRIELHDIDLDLQSVLSSSSSSSSDGSSSLKDNVEVKYAHVKKLTVTLSLVYDSVDSEGDNDGDNNDDNELENQNHTNEDNEGTGLGTSLLAVVELDGVEIHIVPSSSSPSPSPSQHATIKTNSKSRSNSQDVEANSKKKEQVGESKTALIRSGIQSYVQAALDSLKLSLTVTNLDIRVSSSSMNGDGYNDNVHPLDDRNASNGYTSWIGLHLNSVTYHDCTTTTTNKVTEDDNVNSTSRFIFGKEVCVNGILLNAGDNTTSPNHHHHHYQQPLKQQWQDIFQLDGDAKITYTAKSLQQERKHIQQNCHVVVNQTMTCDVHTLTLKRVNGVLNKFMMQRSTNTHSEILVNNEKEEKDGGILSHTDVSAESKHEPNITGHHNRQDVVIDDEEEEMGLLSSILQQQAEARQFAGKEVRGGLLVPDVKPRQGGSRGGVETYESNNAVDNVVTFDAFFDANDGGFSHYQSMCQSIHTDSGNNDNNDGESNVFEMSIGLKEIAITLHLEDVQPEGENNVDSYILLRMGDFNVKSRQFGNETTLGVTVGFFEMEDGMKALQYDGTIQCEKNNIFHFVEGDLNQSSIISPAECFSIMSKIQIIENKKIIEVDIRMEPLQMIYRESTVTNLVKLKDVLTYDEEEEAVVENKDVELHDSSDEAIETDMKISINCDHITMSLPLQQQNDSCQMPIGGCYDSLFSRTGYLVEYPDGLSGPILSVVFTDVVVDVSKAVPSPDPNIILKNHCIGLKCQKSIVSISIPFDNTPHIITKPISESMTAYRYDLLALESETQIDPDAIIRLEYTQTSLEKASDVLKRKRAKQLFPTVTPLSFVKASQQHESEDIDKTYKSYDNQRQGQHSEHLNLNSKKRGVRGSDPQTAMLKEAGECENYLSIHLPSVVVDVSSEELKQLSALLSHSSSQQDNKSDSKLQEKKSEEETTSESNDSLTGLTFRCDQMSVTLHDDFNSDNGKSKEDGSQSLIFIYDGIHTHCLIKSTGLKSIRFVCNDITLYEVLSSGNEMSRVDEYSPPPLIKQSINYRCNLIRKRRITNSTTQMCRAIFFRSKLSHPLSPKTPVLCLDLTIDRNGDDIDQALHIFMYDWTYRYNVESTWINRLTNIINAQKTDEYTSEENQTEIDTVDSLSVTNLFMTISDCNFDYTSPMSFERASRSILRVGEVRVSSNLINPAGHVQAFKVSVADVAMYITNKRFKHNIENSRLSCSNLILNSSDLNTKTSSKHNDSPEQSFEDALSNMDFLSLLTLDCFDAAIAVASSTTESFDGENTAPDVMITLSVGRACLLACADSFSCLTETISELMLKLTMPSTAELEEMRVRDALEKEQRNEDESSRTVDHANHHDPKSQSLHHSSALSHTSDNEISLGDIMEQDLFADDSTLNSQLEQRINREISEEEVIGIEYSIPENEPVVIQDFYTVDNSDVEPRNGTKNSAVKNDEGHDLLENDWTTVDHAWSQDPTIPEGEDQCGGWYADVNNGKSNKYPYLLPERSTAVIAGHQTSRVPRVFSRHVPINPVSDPLSEGDMGASKFAGTEKSPAVKCRVVIQDMSLFCRFFDGYDWKPPVKPSSVDPESKHNAEAIPSQQSSKTTKPVDNNTEIDLMSELLGAGESKNDDDLTGGDSTPGIFEGDDTTSTSKPLVETVRKRIDSKDYQRKCRQTHRFFQFCYSGLKLRLDSFTETEEHCLASCMDLSLKDMFLSETVSSDMPIKILGEWANDNEHPRDLNDGLLMMKMVSMHPENQLSADGKLMSDEGRVTLELLPIRCFIHQSALRFVRSFFRGGEDAEESTTIQEPPPSNVNDPPEMFFQVFKVRPLKLKVNYTPYEIDTSALKDGNYIEILNLLPLEEMVLNLRAVEMRNLTGWGSVLSELACKWVQDVSATQMHKFLTTTSPIHPIANVGDGVKKFVMIPLEEYKQHGHIRKGLRRGTTTLAEVVAFETLNVSSKLTSLAAKKLGSGASSNNTQDNSTNVDQFEPFLPQRNTVPRSMGDISNHAVASLSRGLKEANTKIVIIPYREYHRTGTKGLMKSVIKGIPVAICAPLSGAAEALSYGLLGARNQIRPHLRQEEETSNQFGDDY